MTSPSVIVAVEATAGMALAEATAPSAATSRDALADFCRAEQPKLVGTLTLYTGDRHLAEELAQDAIVRVIVNWREVSRLKSPAAWAHRVALNLANSWFRRSLARRRAVDRLHARPARDGHTADTTTNLALREAVAALPPRQRTALILRYYADLTPPEVAKIMSCKEGTVWALVHQAIDSLRKTPGFEKVTDDRE